MNAGAFRSRRASRERHACATQVPCYARHFVTNERLSTSNCNNQPVRNLFVIYHPFVPDALSGARTWQACPVTNNYPAQSASGEPARATTYAVLLAAGEGSRFIGSLHKLVAELHGRPVYRWALDAVRAAERANAIAGVIVVTGSVDLDLADGVVRAHNPNWASGQASSLHAGIATAAALGADSIVVGLADQPFVTTEAWCVVARASTPIAVATYSGVRAQPVRLHRSVWGELATEGDQGARSLMALRPELVGEVACQGSAADIDTMEDLQRWNSSTNLL